MFSKSRKKTVLDQAQDVASDVADRLGPAVDRARDKAKAGTADARVKAAPYVADVQKKAAPYLEDVQKKAGPVVEDVRERLEKDVLPAVSAAATTASEKTAPYREEAARRGANAAAALRGEDLPKQKGSKLGKLLIVAGLGGLAAVAVRALQGPKSSPWQQSYTPVPPPAAAPVGVVEEEVVTETPTSRPPAPGEPTV